MVGSGGSFESGNPMCYCGGEMEPIPSSFTCFQVYNCPYCGSHVDQYGVIHLPDGFTYIPDEVSKELEDETEVNVVIPSIKDRVKTLGSIPKSWNCIVEKEGNVSEARNRGASKVNGGMLVFADDDISFDPDIVGRIIVNLEPHVIAGIKGHSLGMLKSRMLIMRKEDFNYIGGFDEDMTWMEDTDFCIKAEKKGYSLKQLPRNLVEHETHEKRQGMLGGSAHLYLMKKHGFTYFNKFIVAVFRKGKSLGGELIGY